MGCRTFNYQPGLTVAIQPVISGNPGADRSLEMINRTAKKGRNDIREKIPHLL